MSKSQESDPYECFLCKRGIKYGEKIGGRVQSKPIDKWIDHFVCVSCYKTLWDTTERLGKKL